MTTRLQGEPYTEQDANDFEKKKMQEIGQAEMQGKILKGLIDRVMLGRRKDDE